jgi:hypothetical protein
VAVARSALERGTVLRFIVSMFMNHLAHTFSPKRSPLNSAQKKIVAFREEAPEPAKVPSARQQAQAALPALLAWVAN